MLLCKALSIVLCLCFLAPPNPSLPLTFPAPYCAWVSITADLAGSSPTTQQPGMMPWAPWHKAVQLISQAWLCPLLQFEKLLEKQVSGIGVHCFVLSACSKYLNCGTSSHISCKKWDFYSWFSIFSWSLKFSVAAHIDVMLMMMTACIY